jgi:hypothetical protein
MKALASLLLALACLAAHAQVKDNGPTTIVITFKSPLDKRAAFRAYMEGPGVRQLEQWKKEGVFQDYQVLATSFAGEQVGQFDVTVLLDFATFTDVARWKEIDRRMPGGLSGEALTLAGIDTTTLAYPIGRATAPRRDPSKAAYVLGLYEIEVGPAEYTKYAKGYVEPQLKGWLDGGAMTAYAMYQSHPYQRPALSKWTFLLVLEYTDMRALASSDDVKETVRVTLEKNPAWKALSDDKGSKRKAKGFVFADAITLPKP